MATTKKTKKSCTKACKKAPKQVFLTHKQVDGLQVKLRTAIKATTALIDKKGLNPTHVKALKKYRKMLQDANNYLGWSVSTLAMQK